MCRTSRHQFHLTCFSCGEEGISLVWPSPNTGDRIFLQVCSKIRWLGFFCFGHCLRRYSGSSFSLPSFCFTFTFLALLAHSYPAHFCPHPNFFLFQVHSQANINTSCFRLVFLFWQFTETYLIFYWYMDFYFVLSFSTQNSIYSSSLISEKAVPLCLLLWDKCFWPLWLQKN